MAVWLSAFPPMPWLTVSYTEGTGLTATGFALESSLVKAERD